ncbi:MAG: MFS transporter [Proteobacteria bacterium]|nr:MFS transporter [Pseudomonadota bacterium]
MPRDSEALHPRYPRLIVGLTLANQALVLGVVIYSFALFVVPWLTQFQISRSQVMTAILSFQVMLGVLSPFMGRLMDYYPMRWLVLAGVLAMGVGLVLLSRVTAFWQIVAIYATLLPLGMLLCGTLASQTMVSKWFIEGRSLAIGISSMGTSIGGLLLPALVAFLLLTYDWQNVLMVLAVVTVGLLAPLNYVVLRQNPPRREVVVGTSADDPDGRAWTTGEILTSRAFWLPVSALIPVNAAFGGVQFNLGAYMSDLGHSQAMAAELIALMSIAMIAGKLFFGSMGDRFDHRGLYWLMAGLLVIALLCYTGNPEQPNLMLAAGLQGFATGGVMPMMGIIYARRFGTLSFGRVLGLVNMFLMIGSFGSIFSGWIFDLTQSYDMAFRIFAALLIPGAIVMFFLPERADPPESRKSPDRE